MEDVKLLVPLVGLFTTSFCFALPKVTMEQSNTGMNFKIGNVPGPSANDAATGATFTVVEGNSDAKGGSTAALNDGKVPGNPDDPSKSYVFAEGDKRGRIVVDLGKVISVQAIHTYSWHTKERAPQIYRVYTATGEEKGFSKRPVNGGEPLRLGWEMLVKVDTKRKGNSGQHTVSITDPKSAPLGKFRYLLFEFEPTDPKNAWSNTLINEIDVIEENGPSPEPATT